MSNYTGLTQLKFLLLGAFFAVSAQATEETYSIKVPAEPQTEEALSTAPAAETPSTQETSALPLKPSAPLRYEVKKGDTLWAIAGYFLQNPWQWPEIWYSNDQIKNPHRIYPGNILRLVMVNGRPRLVLGDEIATTDNGTKRLSPSIRSSELKSAIPAIPVEAIRDFLNAPHLISEDELDGTPYILDFTDHHIVGGSATTVFVKDLGDRTASLYSVVRKGDAYRDPDNNDIIGYEAIPVGIAEIKRMDRKIGLAVLSRTSREARIGDHLIAQSEEPFEAFFYPRAPEKDIRGSIISVFDGASQISQYQIVALNRGADDGLAPGHVLTVMQSGRTARDPESWFGRRIQLPDTEAGTVLVFKTMPHFSYALVMDATRAIHAKDSVIKPR